MKFAELIAGGQTKTELIADLVKTLLSARTDWPKGRKLWRVRSGFHYTDRESETRCAADVVIYHKSTPLYMFEVSRRSDSQATAGVRYIRTARAWGVPLDLVRGWHDVALAADRALTYLEDAMSGESNSG